MNNFQTAVCAITVFGVLALILLITANMSNNDHAWRMACIERGGSMQKITSDSNNMQITCFIDETSRIK